VTARAALLALALAGLGLAWADARADDGRLLATGGATQIEGSAGGGLVPWAVIAGYGSRDGQGGTAFHTQVRTGDYALRAHGAAYGFGNRLELSVARQRFDLGTLREQLALPWDALEQDVFGAKLRLAGDLVYTRMPQLSLGLQYKRLRDDALPRLAGARRGEDVDAYASASKLFLDGAFGYQLLLNGTLRYSRGNQAGLLGFGGDRRAGRSWLLEGSAAVLLSPRVAVGVEYRQKPDNLGFAGEDDWRDAFVAWFPNKSVAVVAAWVDLGSIAGLADQRGGYLSVQVSH
jgi:hypothetical protein